MSLPCLELLAVLDPAEKTARIFMARTVILGRFTRLGKKYLFQWSCFHLQANQALGKWVKGSCLNIVSLYRGLLELVYIGFSCRGFSFGTE